MFGNNSAIAASISGYRPDLTFKIILYFCSVKRAWKDRKKRK